MIISPKNIQVNRNKLKEEALKKEGETKVWWPTKLDNGEIALFGEKVYRKFVCLDFGNLKPIYEYRKIEK